jgi:AraC family transcriptional regulator of adaptative response / DNA-3-methyladenine glycosylase II
MQGRFWLVPVRGRVYIAPMNDDFPTSPATGREPPLDPEVCRRARLSRDARFDGAFYLAVKTTGIYCRPICPARAPAEKNVRYFASAALAAQAGFRPCLRCRPESAPNSPAWNGTSTTVQRALQLIGQGALNTGSMGDLALRLGIGERYLRKLFERELGVSPQALALNQRLLFAKKLLAETALPVTEVAYAAGFGSLRRFNSAVQTQFKLPPTALRRRRNAGTASVSIELQLHYRPPYDWDGVLDFFGRHAVDGVETVAGGSYQRTITPGGVPGSFRVSPLPGKNALRLELQLADRSQLMPVVARVRRMFDLDANPAAIHAVLGQDPRLAPLLQRIPGIRSTGHWSLYEASIRGIVGQQISTQAARGVLARLSVAGRRDAQNFCVRYCRVSGGGHHCRAGRCTLPDARPAPRNTARAGRLLQRPRRRARDRRARGTKGRWTVDHRDGNDARQRRPRHLSAERSRPGKGLGTPSRPRHHPATPVRQLASLAQLRRQPALEEPEPMNMQFLDSPIGTLRLLSNGSTAGQDRV